VACVCADLIVTDARGWDGGLCQELRAGEHGRMQTLDLDQVSTFKLLQPAQAAGQEQQGHSSKCLAPPSCAEKCTCHSGHSQVPEVEWAENHGQTGPPRVHLLPRAL
jgi:hypothetical protein